MVDWDQTRKEQGTWPRKFMVSVWLKHETNLMAMIDFLKMMKEELGKAAHVINSLQPHTRGGEGHATEGWQIEKDVVSKICSDFHDFFATVVKSSRPTTRVIGLPAKYTREGEDHANVCTDFDDILFETVIKSAGWCSKARLELGS